MIIRGKLRLAAVGAASLAAFLAVHGGPASAQLSWDWSGGNREVVSFNPKYTAGQIIVSFGDKRLYYIAQTGQAISYPIAVPREKSRWQGVTAISQKRENPSWTPTPDMIKENPRLPRWVPGGHPFNPLGVRALYLGSSMYRIHGTDAPWTIGTAASKGCIRLFNEDVLDLYPRVRIGTKVTVTYQTFTTSGAVSSASSTSKGLFDMFGSDDDDSSAKKQAKRPPRAKSKSTEKSAADKTTSVEPNVAAEKADTSAQIAKAPAPVVETAASNK
jgi:L,D-transpeptidase-like protein